MFFILAIPVITSGSISSRNRGGITASPAPPPSPSATRRPGISINSIHPPTATTHAHTHTHKTPTQNQTSQTGSNSRQRTAAKSVSSCCQSSSVRKDTQIHLKAQKFIGIRTRKTKPTTISIAAIRISLSAFLFIPTDKIQGFSVASVFVSCRRPFKHQEHRPLTPQALHDELATGLDQI